MEPKPHVFLLEWSPRGLSWAPWDFMESMGFEWSRWLGGGNSKIFYFQQIPSMYMVYLHTFLGGGFIHIFYFHPEPWGFMIQVDVRIFFQMGWNQRPTRWHLSYVFWIMGYFSLSLKTSFRPQISWGFPVFFLEPKKKERIPIKKPPNFRRVFWMSGISLIENISFRHTSGLVSSFSGGVFWAVV